MFWIFVIGIGLMVLSGYFIYQEFSSGSSQEFTSGSSQEFSSGSNISHLPKQFVIFDLETTGLSPERNEIIEFGAIKVNRDGDKHDTFRCFVKPHKKLPKKITELTGITESMLESDGDSLEYALTAFLDFVGDLRLVSFNAKFDMAFLYNASAEHSKTVNNPVSCALEMSRRAFPGRDSYRLVDLAEDGGLSNVGTHRALGDCQRTMIIYVDAAAKLGTVD